MTTAGFNETARHLFTNNEDIKRLEEAGIIERDVCWSMIERRRAACGFPSFHQRDRGADA